MSLPYPPQDHHISLEDAARITKNYRDNPPGPKVKGGCFDRAIIDKILAQPGCAGIRCYYAIKDDGSPAIVIVGVSSNGDDIYNGTLAEVFWPCPPYCPTASPLSD